MHQKNVHIKWGIIFSATNNLISFQLFVSKRFLFCNRQEKSVNIASHGALTG